MTRWYYYYLYRIYSTPLFSSLAQLPARGGPSICSSILCLPSQYIDRTPRSTSTIIEASLIHSHSQHSRTPPAPCIIRAMAIKLHGSPISTASMRALVCLYEKGIEFEFCVVDMKNGAHKQEPFISLNPFGQVPAMEDGDLKLFESRAISQYIAHEHPSKGSQLFCPDSKKMATMSVWMEVEAHHFDPVASKLAFELIYKKMFGMETDPAAVTEYESKLASVLDVYEARLSKSKYLAGDEFSLADLHHLPVLHYLTGSSAKNLFEERPHVCAWSKDILARPSWAKVLELQKQG